MNGSSIADNMPSTLEAEEEFLVSSGVAAAWNFFLDLHHIGGCIPGCESVTPIDDTSAFFEIRFKVGYLSKLFKIKARFKDVVSQEKLSFVGEGSDAEILGSLRFQSVRENATLVKYKIEIHPISALGKTAMAMMGKDLVRKQASDFAGCVKAKLEKMSPDRSSA